MIKSPHYQSEDGRQKTRRRLRTIETLRIGHWPIYGIRAVVRLMFMAFEPLSCLVVGKRVSVQENVLDDDAIDKSHSLPCALSGIWLHRHYPRRATTVGLTFFAHEESENDCASTSENFKMLKCCGFQGGVSFSYVWSLTVELLCFPLTFFS